MDRVTTPFRLSPDEENVLLLAANIVARDYHDWRRSRNAKYKPKPNHDGAEARSLRGYVFMSRRARGITE